MKKRIWLLALWLCLCGALSGCGSFRSESEFFSRPVIPAEYEDLSQQLEVLLNDGYSYVMPDGGSYIQALQMRDLDGDGKAEAMAFLRRDADEEPLKIFVFKDEEGTYRRLCIIDSAAQGVESVYYEDLTGDGKLELIVGWEMGGGRKTVSVYNIGRDCLTLVECEYTHYTAADMDRDGRPNLVVLHNDREGQPVVEMYGWQTDILTLSYRGMLSSSMSEISRGQLLSGYFRADMPALFITGITADNTALTDVLVWDEQEGLHNLLPDEKTGRTAVALPYYGQLPQDINGDKIIEFPRYLGQSANSAVAWLQYEANGAVQEVQETYHCQDDGWYVKLPQSWWGRVNGDHFLDSRESQVTLTLDGTPVCSLFTIGGDGRENRAVMGNRFVVKRQTEQVFSAELYDHGSENGMDEDLLRHSFYLTEASWSDGTD